MLESADLEVQLFAPGHAPPPDIAQRFSIRMLCAGELPLLRGACAGPLHARWDALLAVVEPGDAATASGHLADPVTEWLFAGFSPEELVFRLLALLRSRQVRSFALPGAALTFTPGVNTLHFKHSSVRLSPSEFEVAELFFERFGTVIGLGELARRFEQSGKSSAMSNIRVTVFQLRHKLEELTHGALTIDTVYRRGYVLRQAILGAQRGSDAGRELLAAN